MNNCKKINKYLKKMNYINRRNKVKRKKVFRK